MELTFDVESMRHLAIVSDSTQQRATGFGTDSQTYHDVGTRLESHRSVMPSVGCLTERGLVRLDDRWGEISPVSTDAA